MDIQSGHFPLSAKDLAGVDNQISKAFSCSKEFPDYDTDKTQADVYFHHTDDGRD